MNCSEYFEVIPILEILSNMDGKIILEWFFKSEYEKDIICVYINSFDAFKDYKFQLTKSQLNLLYKLLNVDIETVYVNKSMAQPFIQDFQKSPLYKKYIDYCNGYFEVLSIFEILSKRHSTIVLQLFEEWMGKTDDEKDMFNISLIGTSSIEDYHIKSYTLTKSQLNLFFKLLSIDAHCVFKIDGYKTYRVKISGSYSEISVFKMDEYYDSYYDIRVDKSIPPAILNDFQKSPLNEKYLQYKSEKETQRQKNLLKYK